MVTKRFCILKIPINKSKYQKSTNCLHYYSYEGSYALVICNHTPLPVPGNSGGFDLWFSKSLLKAPSCGDYSLVKSLLFTPAACYLFISLPFCLYKANPGYFPRTAVAKRLSKPRSFSRLSPPSPGRRVVVTND